MPVRRFRSAEEMNQPHWREPGDPDLYRAIRAVWDLGRRTATSAARPGVRRFRSVEEMDAAQELAEIENTR